MIVNSRVNRHRRRYFVIHQNSSKFQFEKKNKNHKKNTFLILKHQNGIKYRCIYQSIQINRPIFKYFFDF